MNLDIVVVGAGTGLALLFVIGVVWAIGADRRSERQDAEQDRELDRAIDEFARQNAYLADVERALARKVGEQPQWRRDMEHLIDEAPRVDDEPTEYVVREPAIYTNQDVTKPVNVRRDKPKPWEWAK